MRKAICILAVLLVTGLASLYGKRISHIISEKPSNKTVRFSVFATDYSAPIFKKSKAKVTLTICKFYDGRQETVWEGVVDEKGIKNYPNRSKSLYREVCIHNVYDKKESYAAYYEVVYDFNGSKMSYVEGISLSKGSGTDSLKVSI
jgi:hypothetical protein